MYLIKLVRFLAAVASLFILLALPENALAESSVKGIIARVTSTGIQLLTGRSYARQNKGVGVAAPEFTINGPAIVNDDYLNGPQHIISNPTWFSLHDGDYVQLNLDAHGKIAWVNSLGKLNNGRIEQTALEYKTASGGWYLEQDVPINGRVFAQAGTMSVVNDTDVDHPIADVVIPNHGKWDYFEAWVGKRSDTGTGSIKFAVLADGKELYRTPSMTSNDAAVKILVPITGCSGVTLRSYGDDANGYYKSAVWGSPLFVKASSSIGRKMNTGTVSTLTIVRRTEHSLVGVTPVTGDWETDNSPASIGGRVFSKTVTMTLEKSDDEASPQQPVQQVIFANKDNADLFECSVGFKDNLGKGWVRFQVEADGKKLFTSQKMSQGDAPVKLSVPIKGCSGVSLKAQGSGDRDYLNNAVWANPVLVYVPNGGSASP